jgi:hypothetical protein
MCLIRFDVVCAHVLALAVLFACSGEPKTTSKDSLGARDITLPSMFSAIPSDTPYIVAGIEPFPDEVLDSIAARLTPEIERLQKSLTTENNQMPKGENTDSARVFRALMTELKGKLTRQGIEGLGFNLKPRFALYGLGPIPVLRVELKDEASVKALVRRIETQAQVKATMAKLGDQSYWVTGGDEVTIVVAFIKGDLMISMMPSSMAPTVLPYALGQKTISKSMADGTAFLDMLKSSGFKGLAAGYVDVGQIIAGVFGKTSGTTGIMWNKSPFVDHMLPEICAKEFASIGTRMSRLEFGVVSYQDKRFVGRTYLYSTPSLTRFFREATIPLPGLGRMNDDLMDFGLALKFGAVAERVKQTVSTIATTPFQCPTLNEINLDAAQIGPTVTSVISSLPPALLGVNGVYARVTAFDMSKKDPWPPTDGDVFKASIIVGVEKPTELLTVLKGILPSLAFISEKMDGPPVSLASLDFIPTSLHPYFTIRKGMFGFAFGQGYARQLDRLMKEKTSTPAKFFSYSYDVKRFLGAALKATQGSESSEGLTGDDEAEKIVQRVVEAIGKLMVTVHSEKGRFVVESTVQLN